MESPDSLWDIAACLVVWYISSAIFNHFNIRVLEVFPYPAIVATLQIGCGLLLALPAWLFGVRKVPVMTLRQVRALAPVALWHLIGLVAAAEAVSSGGGAFANVVKGFEPLCVVFVGRTMLNSSPHRVAALSLWPLVVGLAIAASSSALKFGWWSFWTAVLSNVAMSLRGAHFMRALESDAFKHRHVSTPHIFAAVSILSFTASLPFALVIDGVSMAKHWSTALEKVGARELVGLMVCTGFCNGVFNEMAFIAMRRLGLLSYSVADAVKTGTVLYTLSAIVLEPLTGRAMAGTGLSACGLISYVLGSVQFSFEDPYSNEPPPRE